MHIDVCKYISSLDVDGSLFRFFVKKKILTRDYPTQRDDGKTMVVEIIYVKSTYTSSVEKSSTRAIVARSDM